MMILSASTISDPSCPMVCHIISNWSHRLTIDNNTRHMMVMILFQVLPVIYSIQVQTFFCWYLPSIGEGFAIASTVTFTDPFDLREIWLLFQLWMILLVIIINILRLLWCSYNYTDWFFNRLLVVVLLLWLSKSIITGCATMLIDPVSIVRPTTMVATAANSPPTTPATTTAIGPFNWPSRSIITGSSLIREGFRPCFCSFYWSINNGNIILVSHFNNHTLWYIIINYELW